MPKSVGHLGLGRKKGGGGSCTASSARRRPFKEYHAEWVQLLRDSLLPRLRRAMHESSLAHLSTQVDVVRHHLTSYYDALDLAATATTTADDEECASSAASLLYPGCEWRTPLESPFLWLGDLHPYLFTNLLRSFLDSDNQEDEDEDPAEAAFELRLRTRFALLNESNELFNRPWHIVTAWRSPSASLMARVEQIECGVRLMVPALMARARKAQSGFVVAVAVAERTRNEEAVAKAMVAEMEEMVGVLVDANRLRRSVLSEIVGATSVYQGALFLEALSQFLVGFRDPSLLAEFEACKTPLRRITLSHLL